MNNVGPNDVGPNDVEPSDVEPSADEPKTEAAGDVVITARGAISPFGDAAATTAAVLAGRDGLSQLDEAAIRALDRGADPDALKTRRAGRVDFNPREVFAGRNFRPVDRTGQLVIQAAEAALAGAGWTEPLRRERHVGLVLGTMFGSVHTISAFDRRGLEAGPKYVKPLDFANSVINAAAGQTAIWLGLTGTNSTITGGPAAGVMAIAQATQLIRDGRAGALLAGGADELSFEALLGFEQAGRLSPSGTIRPFDARRDGTLLGEGAALLMVEQAAPAAQRGAPILAYVRGHGSGFDTSRGRDAKRAARALERAIREALDATVGDSNEQSESVDAVFCGACGLPGDVAEGLALASIFGDRVPVTGVAGSLGCTLGAAGAFQALQALDAMTADGARIPPLRGFETPDPLLAGQAFDAPRRARAVDVRRALLTATSLDGLVAAVVLERAA